MKRAPRSRQRHDLYAKYHDYDSEISDLLGECGLKAKGKAGHWTSPCSFMSKIMFTAASDSQKISTGSPFTPSSSM